MPSNTRTIQLANNTQPNEIIKSTLPSLFNPPLHVLFFHGETMATPFQSFWGLFLSLSFYIIHSTSTNHVTLLYNVLQLSLTPIMASYHVLFSILFLWFCFVGSHSILRPQPCPWSSCHYRVSHSTPLYCLWKVLNSVFSHLMSSYTSIITTNP